MFDTVKCVLLDIEGTTSSISFVHDEMFPFVLQKLDSYLEEHFLEPEVQSACEQIASDAGFESLEDWSNRCLGSAPQELVKAEVRRLMEQDAKHTGLKALQGLIWQQGFDSGALQAHVFPDVVPAIRRWRELGLDVRIYSSGSVAAQKLFFGHLAGEGNRLDLFSGHYDTRIGNKKEKTSYERIAADWNVSPQTILFISDVPAELEAARQAGVNVLGSRRPGNQSVPSSQDITWITSFDEVTQHVAAAR